jgi:hypothetical protein
MVAVNQYIEEMQLSNAQKQPDEARISSLCKRFVKGYDVT